MEDEEQEEEEDGEEKGSCEFIKRNCRGLLARNFSPMRRFGGIWGRTSPLSSLLACEVAGRGGTWYTDSLKPSRGDGTSPRKVTPLPPPPLPLPSCRVAAVPSGRQRSRLK